MNMSLAAHNNACTTFGRIIVSVDDLLHFRVLVLLSLEIMNTRNGRNEIEMENLKLTTCLPI